MLSVLATHLNLSGCRSHLGVIEVNVDLFSLGWRRRRLGLDLRRRWRCRLGRRRVSNCLDLILGFLHLVK